MIVRRGAYDQAADDSALIWNRECHWSEDWEDCPEEESRARRPAMILPLTSSLW